MSIQPNVDKNEVLKSMVNKNCGDERPPRLIDSDSDEGILNLESVLNQEGSPTKNKTQKVDTTKRVATEQNRGPPKNLMYSSSSSPVYPQKLNSSKTLPKTSLVGLRTIARLIERSSMQYIASKLPNVTKVEEPHAKIETIPEKGNLTAPSNEEAVKIFKEGASPLRTTKNLSIQKGTNNLLKDEDKTSNLKKIDIATNEDLCVVKEESTIILNKENCQKEEHSSLRERTQKEENTENPPKGEFMDNKGENIGNLEQEMRNFTVVVANNESAKSHVNEVDTEDLLKEQYIRSLQINSKGVEAVPTTSGEVIGSSSFTEKELRDNIKDLPISSILQNVIAFKDFERVSNRDVENMKQTRRDSGFEYRKTIDSPHIGTKRPEKEVCDYVRAENYSSPVVSRIQPDHFQKSVTSRIETDPVRDRAASSRVSANYCQIDKTFFKFPANVVENKGRKLLDCSTCYMELEPVLNLNATTFASNVKVCQSQTDWESSERNTIEATGRFEDGLNMSMMDVNLHNSIDLEAYEKIIELTKHSKPQREKYEIAYSKQNLTTQYNQRCKKKMKKQNSSNKTSVDSKNTIQKARTYAYIERSNQVFPSPSKLKSSRSVIKVKKNSKKNKIIDKQILAKPYTANLNLCEIYDSKDARKYWQYCKNQRLTYDSLQNCSSLSSICTSSDEYEGNVVYHHMCSVENDDASHSKVSLTMSVTSLDSFRKFERGSQTDFTDGDKSQKILTHRSRKDNFEQELSFKSKQLKCLTQDTIKFAIPEKCHRNLTQSSSRSPDSYKTGSSKCFQDTKGKLVSVPKKLQDFKTKESFKIDRINKKSSKYQKEVHETLSEFLDINSHKNNEKYNLRSSSTENWTLKHNKNLIAGNKCLETTGMLVMSRKIGDDQACGDSGAKKSLNTTKSKRSAADAFLAPRLSAGECTRPNRCQEAYRMSYENCHNVTNNDGKPKQSTSKITQNHYTLIGEHYDGYLDSDEEENGTKEIMENESQKYVQMTLQKDVHNHTTSEGCKICINTTDICELCQNQIVNKIQFTKETQTCPTGKSDETHREIFTASQTPTIVSSTAFDNSAQNAAMLQSILISGEITEDSRTIPSSNIILENKCIVEGSKISPDPPNLTKMSSADSENFSGDHQNVYNFKDELRKIASSIFKEHPHLKQIIEVILEKPALGNRQSETNNTVALKTKDVAHKTRDKPPFIDKYEDIQHKFKNIEIKLQKLENSFEENDLTSQNSGCSIKEECMKSSTTETVSQNVQKEDEEKICSCDKGTDQILENAKCFTPSSVYTSSEWENNVLIEICGKLSFLAKQENELVSEINDLKKKFEKYDSFIVKFQQLTDTHNEDFCLKDEVAKIVGMITDMNTKKKIVLEENMRLKENIVKVEEQIFACNCTDCKQLKMEIKVLDRKIKKAKALIEIFPSKINGTKPKMIDKSVQFTPMC